MSAPNTEILDVLRNRIDGLKNGVTNLQNEDYIDLENVLVTLDRIYDKRGMIKNDVKIFRPLKPRTKKSP